MINSMSSDDRIKNSFDSIGYIISNPPDVQANNGYRIQNERIYQSCKKVADQKDPSSDMHEIIKIANLLYSMSTNFENDYSKITEFQNDYYTGKTGLRSNHATTQFQKILNNILVNLCNSLSEVGYIDFLLERHNKKCTQNYVSVLKVTPEQMQDEFNRNKHCDAPTSYIKIAFWANKFIKLIDTIQTSSLNRFNSIYMDPAKLTEEDKHYLSAINDKIKIFLTSMYMHSPTEEQETAYIDGYKEQYSKLLSPYIGPAADLNAVFKFFRIFETSKSTIYQVKNQLTNTLIHDCLMDYKMRTASPQFKNWGITKDLNDPTKYIFSIHAPGSLFPCTFHLPEDSLFDTMNFLKLNKIDIPEYNFVKLFSTYSTINKSFPINIICPPTATQKKEIKKIALNKNGCPSIISSINTHLNGGTYISHKNSIHIELDK